jgi:hypothetical protein
MTWRSPSPAPCCSLHGWEDNMRIHSLDTVVCCLAGTVLLSVLLNSGAVPPLFSENLSGEGAALTRRAVASARTVAAHALAHLLQAIIMPRAALWRDRTPPAYSIR